jgi:hypothetical protein
MVDLLREGGRQPEFKVVMYDFQITGRQKKRKVAFSLDLVVEVDGRRFCLSSMSDHFFENATLTIQLPQNAMTISSV